MKSTIQRFWGTPHFRKPPYLSGMTEAVMLRSDSLSVAKACESPTTKWHLMKSADQHLGAPWIGKFRNFRKNLDHLDGPVGTLGFNSSKICYIYIYIYVDVDINLL